VPKTKQSSRFLPQAHSFWQLDCGLGPVCQFDLDPLWIDSHKMTSLLDEVHAFTDFSDGLARKRSRYQISDRMYLRGKFTKAVIELDS